MEMYRVSCKKILGTKILVSKELNKTDCVVCGKKKSRFIKN